MVCCYTDVSNFQGEIEVYIEEVPLETSSLEWTKEDARVILWLWNSTEPLISSDVMLVDSVYSVWQMTPMYKGSM